MPREIINTAGIWLFQNAVPFAKEKLLGNFV
jgi:hypothetical protein